MVSSHSQPTRGESPMSTNRQPLPISSTRATTTAAAGIPHFHFPNSQICLRFHFPGNHRSYSSARTIQELLADSLPTLTATMTRGSPFTPDAVKKTTELFEKKFKRHEDLLKNFTHAETLDEAFTWMNRIDKFEQKHFKLRQSIGSLEKQIIQGGLDEDEFDDMKEKDDILLEKLNDIDKILEEKLAELDHAFGKKRKVLEEEIRDLAE
ncbi:ribosomal protein S5 family protein [Actinidia rufa]|uniref:Ribosomal protein S5 family protein n=1 Tax=Actinidia rufa TaxID=165716 RepID=A0A7J0EIG3_9ERIC|nr:ribosomal protein S5 family protein [Actinidia rufa]